MHTLNALESFIATWLVHNKDALPGIEFDPQWPSLCYRDQNLKSGDMTSWQPQKQTSPSDIFTRLGAALETDIHPDITAYYTSYWSNHLSAVAPAGDLVLLQVWNEEDMERLRANLIGHCVTKIKQKQPLSLFFACTEPDDGILTLRNDDGTIWLEYPGKKPVKQIADNLPAFLSQLKPR
ncbi:SecY-interacting protein [Neptunomonas antarctica]|uniref:SecY interacting protein Syd n=1 Tax=Neptunomonas antarctica TaxID=619304 RepID=A0A1N7KCS4_9GAMM|nr:SecY-interacting protein [Neptunomonas antarctica]SIS59395.1 SecY interacting protein Syd [Neptunomonas antarctica]